MTIMLKEILKKIGQHTLIYSVGNILSRMIGFFMIPVYTHYLTPGDYGVIELLDLTTYFISMVIGVGMSHAILRFYYEYQDQEQRNQVISTAFIFTLGILVLALAVLYPLSQRISQLIFGTVQYRPYLQIIFATMCLGILIELALSYVRAKQPAAGAPDPRRRGRL